MATTYLESDFTGTGASGPAIATYSFWVKLELSDDRATLVSGKDNGSYLKIRFADDGSGHYLGLYGTGMDMKSTRVFRDPSAWYHVVMAFDTGQAASDDRIKVWINNEQITDWASNTRFGQNSDLYLTKADNVQIGAYNNTEHFDGVMAHVHCCDGTAYTPTDFGETDSTSGIWIPKTSPSVTYGSKGYFLKFASGAHGTDSSGNGNDFTVNGTMTNTKDTPENNFATWNPLNMTTVYKPTFSNGATTCVSQDGSGNYWGSASTLGFDSGKWYAEFKAVTASNKPSFGITQAPNTHAYWESYLGKRLYDYAYISDGYIYNNDSGTSAWGDTFTTGDIIMVAVDLDNLKIYFGKNGTWQNSGDPTSGATGTGAAYTITAPTASTQTDNEASGYYHFACSDQGSGQDTMSANFGNGYFQTTAVSSSESDDAGIGSFEYDVPAGYYALCTTNLGDQS